MISAVVLSARATKDLRTCPRHIVRNLLAWVEAIELDGLEQVRKLPGYHDEPLQGEWSGFRSIRLSLSYRAIYTIREGENKEGQAAEFVRVERVNKHRY